MYSHTKLAVCSALLGTLAVGCIAEVSDEPAPADAAPEPKASRGASRGDDGTWPCQRMQAIAIDGTVIRLASACVPVPLDRGDPPPDLPYAFDPWVNPQPH